MTAAWAGVEIWVCLGPFLTGTMPTLGWDNVSLFLKGMT